MSETYQPTPADIEAAESHMTPEELSRSNYRDKLSERFNSVSDDDFELYKDEERRGKLRFDVESVCRHAIAMDADYAIFMDKAARGYGLLAHKILPILRLEFAERENIAIDDVPDPKIKFYNDLHLSKKYNEYPLQIKSIQEKFKFMADKRILIFDESTNFTSLHQRYYRNMTVDEQYKVFSSDIRFNPDDSPEVKKEKELYGGKYNQRDGFVKGTGAEKAAKLFHHIFPDAIIDFQIGTSGRLGGHDILGRNLAYNIQNKDQLDLDIDSGPFVTR